MIYVAIVDDNSTYLEDMEHRCKECLKNITNTIHAYSSYDELKNDEEYLNSLDILISDIELGEKNGIEEAKQIKEQRKNLCVLFVSSYIKYAPMVYDVEHLYFVLKDQLDLRFDKAMAAAVRYVKSIKNKTLSVKWKGKVECIPIEEIVLVERQNRKTRIATTNSEYFTYTPYQEIIDSLKKEEFIRIHYSYFINLHFVKHFERDHVIVRNDEFVPVSRSYEKEAKESFLKYLSSEVFF